MEKRCMIVLQHSSMLLCRIKIVFVKVEIAMLVLLMFFVIATASCDCSIRVTCCIRIFKPIGECGCQGMFK